MNINITGKNMVVTNSVSERVMKKVGKMERDLGANISLQVRLTKEKNNRRKCEITVPFEGVTLRAEASNDDNLYISIDQALAKLERQIHKHRTKLEKRIRTSELEPVVEAPVYEEQSYDIVRTKKFTVKPMGVEDAITQMELLGHDFFLFLNEENETMNVLYRRNDGSYGLLQPEN